MHIEALKPKLRLSSHGAAPPLPNVHVDVSVTDLALVAEPCAPIWMSLVAIWLSLMGLIVHSSSLTLHQVVMYH